MNVLSSRVRGFGLLASSAVLLGLTGTVPAIAQTSPTAVGQTAAVSAAAAKDPVEKHLTANAIAVHRAAQVAWPEIKTYYGYRNDPSSDHYKGKALDLMVPGYKTRTGRLLGRHVAIWARDNHEQLHIQYVIWNQHIWNVSRADEGWRLMADRGSDSANHMNHVHISVQ